MNEELIQKLVDQCVDKRERHGTTVEVLQSRKFAELIVKECVQVCADRGAHHDGLYSAWADDCSKRIGKHFGVEE